MNFISQQSEMNGPMHGDTNEDSMIDILRKRRSIRKYTNEPISDAVLRLLQEAVLRAPTSRALNPWEFIFVTDKKMLDKLSHSKPHGAHFLRDAALGVVIVGDETTADTWIEDCSIAAIILQLACTSVGLGSCWVQVRLRPHDENTSAETFVQNQLGLPEHKHTPCIISIGYPAESKKMHTGEDLPTNKISHWIRA